MAQKQKGNFIQTKVLPATSAMQNNIIISSIMQGMMSTMPVLMAGAIFQLIYSFPIPAWQNLLKSIGLYGLLTTCVEIFNLSAIFMVFAIGRAYAEKKKVDSFYAGLISLLAFLIITPITSDDAGNKMINVTSLGAQGIITAMIVGLLASGIYSFVVNKNIKISMPDSVPVFVSNSFENIPTALITIIPFVALRGIFSITPYGNLTQFIYSMLQIPLTGVGNSFGGHLILMLAACLLWWFGVHGTMAIIPFVLAIMNAPLLENITAVNAGNPAPHLLSIATFFIILQFLGGPGCVFGLYLNMAFLSKSERFKAQGKISLVPGLFNVIEPTVYGLPIVLNPVLLLPFVGLPLVLYTIFYLCLKAGLFTTPVIVLASVVPGPVAGFLLGGGIGLGIFCILACVLSTVVYYPFFKVLDNQALKEEAAASVQEA